MPEELQYAKSIKIPTELWEEIEEEIAASDLPDLDFSKWARRAFRNEIARSRMARASASAAIPTGS